MAQAKVQPYIIKPWQSENDSTAFSSGMESIDRYIKQQAARDMSSRASLVFVLTEPGNNTICAYYTLSSLGIIFNDLPENIQKNLPRYPQMGATLLGRLGIDRNYNAAQHEKLGQNPRLGELLLVDAQKKTLQGASTTSGSALLIVDVKQPTAEDLANGVREPMGFYTPYGFAPLPGNPHRLFKLTQVIETELAQANV